MKVLILAIVLCVAEAQARGKSSRQSYGVYNRQEAEKHYDTVTGAEMMFFIIKTMANLQSLFEAHEWEDLHAHPDISLPLPNMDQDNEPSSEKRDRARGSNRRWGSLPPDITRFFDTAKEFMCQ